MVNIQLVPIPITLAEAQSEEWASFPQDVLKGSIHLFEKVGYLPPFVGYGVSLDGQWVGTGAFKGPPQNNKVEIAYYTFPEFEGKGMGSAICKHLVSLAKKAQPELDIMAQTLPKESASSSILKKNGFKKIGEFIHPEDGKVWEWKWG
ncbi:MAG: GNAT family N-acetyltransferase [Bacteroidota bacterium]